MNKTSKLALAALCLTLSATPSAHAGSFWSFTSNSNGEAKTGCAVDGNDWAVVSCVAKANSSIDGSGSGSIGIVFFGTKRDEQASGADGFAEANDTEAVSGCQSFTLNEASAGCDLTSTANSASPDASERSPRKRGFGLVNW